MIKKQQKWIALFVALTFVWLLQVSTMPVSAAGSSEQIRSVSSEQGPNFIEGEGSRAPRGKGKSILPWILIGVGVITVTGLVIVLFALNNYDITGTWKFHVVATNFGYIYDWQLTFSGTKKSGTFFDDDDWTGTYSVKGKTINYISYNEGNIDLVGEFTDKDTMSGTYTWTDWSEYGTWTATRVGSAAAAPKAPAKIGGKKDRAPRSN